jgi:ribulose-phosphate 3-epimerase
MFEIIPSPGTDNKTWEEIAKKIELVKPFAKSIHIDVIDGKFAENTTFSDPAPFKQYTADTLFEVHFMTEEPVQYIDAWAAAGFKRFIGQIEKMSDQAEFIAKAEQFGYAGLAIDGPTPLDKLTVSHLDLDTLLIMTIKAGFSGQEFQPEHLEKIKTLLKETELFPAEVDGGINEQTITAAWNAGARRFVTTSALYGAADPVVAYQKLHELCAQLEEQVWTKAA